MLRTHRQRVPAMLVVACVGMMVYAVAGAAPGDGRELAPAATSTTAKGDKDSTTKTPAKDGCEGSATSTTAKDGDGKDGDGKGSGSTSTTAKDGDGKDADGKDGDRKASGSTSTTAKDGDGKDGDGKDGKGDSGSSDKDPKTDVTTAAAVKGDAGSTPTAGKDGKTSSGSSGKDGCEEPNTPTTDKDGKDGKGSTTTTRKGGDDKDGKGTTTTTDRRDRPTTSTTEKPDTVEPTTPSGGDPGSGGTDSGGSTDDPGAAPIEPQEAPPEAPAAEPEEAADPGMEDGGEFYDMPDEGPVAWDEDEVAMPMAAPGEAEPVIPTFGGSSPKSGGRAAAPSSRPGRSRATGQGREWQLAAPPLMVSSSPSVQSSAAMTESAAVSRRLGGLQTSATESAFPADIISTPKVFPINRRDPLAAAALVLLVGVSRELFKVWRRRASDFWPA